MTQPELPELDNGGIIEFPQGLLGFPAAKRFILVEESGNSFPIFRWLKSVDDSDISVVVVDPTIFVENYVETIPRKELIACDLQSFEGQVFLSIVTVPSADPLNSTVNLLAPLVIAPETRIGKQLVLSDSPYSAVHPICKRVKEVVGVNKKESPKAEPC